MKTKKINDGKSGMRMRRAGCLAAALAVLFAMLTGAAGTVQTSAASTTEFPASGIDASQNGKGSITLKINENEWFVKGTVFRLYQVARLSEESSGNLAFAFTNNFENIVNESGYEVTSDSIQAQDWPSVNGHASNAEWMKTAQSLIQYVRDKNLAADDSQTIENKDTGVTFSKLQFGLYLIQGDTAREGNRTVTYQPVLICIPQGISQAWSYTITGYVKSADPTYDNGGKHTPGPSGTPGGTGTPSPSVTGTVVPSGSVTPSGSVKPSGSVTPSATGTPTRGTTRTPSGTSTPHSGGWSSGHYQTTSPSESTSASGTALTQNAKTGDTSAAFVYGGLMIVTAAVICLLLIYRKKKDHS